MPHGKPLDERSAHWSGHCDMNRNRSFLRIIGVLAVAGVIYLIGGYTASRDLWPWPLMRLLKLVVLSSDPPRPFTFDKIGRLTGKIGSEIVNCPQQNERTAVILIVGQSNAGNHGGQKTKSEYGSRIVNLFGRHCYFAASPLLGSTGTWGEYWTEMANLLVRTRRFETIVLVPAAVSNTAVAHWARRGELNQMLGHTLEGVTTAGLTVTHVLWHQGEADAAIGTGEKEYRLYFLAFIDSIRAFGVDAPVYVSVTTKCLLAASYFEGNSVARAQST